jgi:hypothetical protein
MRGKSKMRASEILRTVENGGGAMWLAGAALRYRLPEAMLPMLDELRLRKWELVELLEQRPTMPPGVKLVHWEPLSPPVRLNRCVIVTDTARFIEVTLGQLGARLQGHDWSAGNWSLSELIGRLEAVGVGVTLIEDVQSVH